MEGKIGGHVLLSISGGLGHRGRPLMKMSLDTLGNLPPGMVGCGQDLHWVRLRAGPLIMS